MQGNEVETNWRPRHVLVGYDGSDGAADAVRLARTLCAGSDAEVLLVNVLLYPGPLPVAYRLLGYDEAPGWKTFFKDAEAELAGLTVKHHTYVGGSPAKVLNDLAEDEDVDLVVFGSPHRGAVGRAFLGSVAEGLLHGATVAAVAAPRGYHDRVHDGFARVVVGYDGSTEAAAAISAGESIARREGVELHVVSVTTPPVVAPGPFAGAAPSALPDARSVCEQGVKLADPELDVRGIALEGPAITELAAYCGPDDLLLLGSRSYGPIARTLLGSVSSGLIHESPCPVLVVPRPQAVAEKRDEATAAETVG